MQTETEVLLNLDVGTIKSYEAYLVQCRIDCIEPMKLLTYRGIWFKAKTQRDESDDKALAEFRYTKAFKNAVKYGPPRLKAMQKQLLRLPVDVKGDEAFKQLHLVRMFDQAVIGVLDAQGRAVPDSVRRAAWRKW